MLAESVCVVPASTQGSANARRIRSETTRVLLLLDVDEQHGELVAAEPRRRVGGPQGALEPRGHDPEQVVAGLVAERVVDRLEVVDVDVEDRDVARAAVERVRHPVHEQAAGSRARSGDRGTPGARAPPGARAARPPCGRGGPGRARRRCGGRASRTAAAPRRAKSPPTPSRSAISIAPIEPRLADERREHDAASAGVAQRRAEAPSSSPTARCWRGSPVEQGAECGGTAGSSAAPMLDLAVGVDADATARTLPARRRSRPGRARRGTSRAPSPACRRGRRSHPPRRSARGSPRRGSPGSCARLRSAVYAR